MKKTDFAMILLIASVSVMVAYFVAGSIPGLKQASTPVTVEVATPIDPEIGEIDKTVFNSAAINPTEQVTIGGSETPGEQ